MRDTCWKKKSKNLKSILVNGEKSAVLELVQPYCKGRRNGKKRAVLISILFYCYIIQNWMSALNITIHIEYITRTKQCEKLM